MLSEKWKETKETSLFWRCTGNAVAGSFFLGWLLPRGSSGTQGELSLLPRLARAYRESRVAKGTELLARWWHEGLFALGDLWLKLAATSFFARHPLALAGLLLLIFLAWDLGVPTGQGPALWYKGALVLLGLSLVLAATKGWFEGSLIGKFFSWWEGQQDAQTKEDISHSNPQPMEYTLFLAVAYVFFDYFLRLYSPLAFLTGIWDELLLLFLVFALMGTGAVRKRRLSGTYLLLPFSLYLAVYLFLFLAQGRADAQAVEGLRVYVQYPLWFFVGANLLYSKRQFKWLSDFFLLVALVTALYGIYQYLAGVEIPTSWIDSKVETSLKTRVFSFVGSPNLLGSLMVLALPTAVGAFMASRRWSKKAVYLISAGILALCLVFTFSRGAWLACLLALLLLGLWVDKRLIAGLLIAAFLTPAVMPSVYDRLAYMTTPEFKASSERGGRLGRWDKSLAVWQTSPATGVGLGRFGGAVAARYFPDESFYTDNFYLKTGVETGWIGLFALLFLLLRGIRLARSGLNQVDDEPSRILGLGILAGLVGVLGHNLVENVFESPMMATYFWLFLGLVVSLYRTEKKAEVGE